MTYHLNDKFCCNLYNVTLCITSVTTLLTYNGICNKYLNNQRTYVHICAWSSHKMHKLCAAYTYHSKIYKTVAKWIHIPPRHNHYVIVSKARNTHVISAHTKCICPAQQWTRNSEHISYGPSEHALCHFYVTHSDSWTASLTRTWQLRKQHSLFWSIVSTFQHNQLWDGSYQMSERILALCTKPSLPTFVSSTNPIGHSSRIKTRSPGLTFGYGLNHFWRRLSSGYYSRNHRFQNWSTMYWTCLHHRQYMSLMCVIPHGYAKLPRNNKWWFWVSGASSSTSSLHFVNGRLLIRFPTSHITVCSTSSVSLILVTNNATKIWRMVRIICSHRPPWWEAWEGLKDHSTFWRRALQMILLR